MVSGVRDSVAAGTLYAADPQQLRIDIDNAIQGADSEFTNPKLLILPNCGLTSAPDVSGGAMLMLETERDNIERVVLIADAPMVGSEHEFAGIAIPRSIAFRTPLGDVLLDREGIDQLALMPNVIANDRPFLRDTALESHIPALQRLLGSPMVIPILVGRSSVHEVVDLLERIWGDRSTLLIVSTNMGSGVDANKVQKQGKAICKALTRSEVSKLEQAPIRSPKSVAAALTIIGRRSMGLLELGSATLKDPEVKDEIVHFGAFAAWESKKAALSEVDVWHLSSLARSAVEVTVLGARISGIDMKRVPPALSARRATVVTLRHNGETRGSAGSVDADRALAASVVRNAAAACNDPRLPSVQPPDLKDLEIGISVLSPIERIFPSNWLELFHMLEKGRHGVLVNTQSRRAAQLPAMWANWSDHQSFVGAVLAKTQLTFDSDVEDASWYRFETFNY